MPLLAESVNVRDVVHIIKIHKPCETVSNFRKTCGFINKLKKSIY